MNQLDINTLLERNQIKEEIVNLLKNFNNNKDNFSLKRGIYKGYLSKFIIWC